MIPAAITIVLDDRRKRLGMWWQKLQHAIGGVPLLIAGAHRLQAPGGGGDLLAIAEIVVATVLLLLLARDLRSEAFAKRAPAPNAPVPDAPRTHSHAHAGPDWFDLVAGALLILEAVHSSHPGGKPFYERPAFFLGVVTGTIGLLHGKLTGLSWRRREIHLDEFGIRARTSRFRGFTVPWPDVRDIRITERAIIIDTAARSRTIALRRYRNAAEIREAFVEWDAARALPDAS
jgi:hypothetical protein